MIYAGFIPRMRAAIVDQLIFLPFTGAIFWLAHSSSRRVAIIMSLVGVFPFLIYQIWLHARCGQTLGKKFTSIKILKLDGGGIGWREATLRSSVEIFLGLLTAIALTIALTRVTDKAFQLGHAHGIFAMQHLTFEVELGKHLPIPKWIVTLQQVWFYSELLFLLFNKKKRAIHDFIAGTVVVRVDSRGRPLKDANKLR